MYKVILCCIDRLSILSFILSNTWVKLFVSLLTFVWQLLLCYNGFCVLQFVSIQLHCIAVIMHFVLTVIVATKALCKNLGGGGVKPICKVKYNVSQNSQGFHTQKRKEGKIER